MRKKDVFSFFSFFHSFRTSQLLIMSSGRNDRECVHRRLCMVSAAVKGADYVIAYICLRVGCCDCCSPMMTGNAKTLNVIGAQRRCIPRFFISTFRVSALSVGFISPPFSPTYSYQAIGMPAATLIYNIYGTDRHHD